MIYKHYKGGLYYNIGMATKFFRESENDLKDENIMKVYMARYTEAKTPEEEKPIPVFAIKFNNAGGLYYAYDTDVIDGLHIFYKDLKGNYWLRPRELFFETLENGTKRFTKIKDEELFNTISKLLADKD